MPPFNVRNHNRDDLENCVDCYRSGFFESDSSSDRKFLRDCTDALIGMSNFTLVAETDGKIAGFIGVTYKKTFNRELSKTSDNGERHKSFVTITLKRHLGLYRLSKEFKDEFKRFITEVMKRPANIADDCDCEVVVLTSKKNFRCGTGTALMNEAMSRCRNNGAKRMRIATDTSFSYQFYDKFGTVVYENDYVINGICGKTFVYEINL